MVRWMAVVTMLVMFAAMLVGCGAEPDYVTAHGLKVYDETSSGAMAERKAELERATEWAIADYPYGGALRRALDGLELYVGDEPHVEDGEVFSGWYDPDMGPRDVSGPLIRIYWDPLARGCLPILPFGHEMMHHWERVLHDRGDKAHSDTRLWGDCYPEACGGAAEDASIDAAEELCS